MAATGVAQDKKPKGCPRDKNKGKKGSGKGGAAGATGG